MLEYDARIFPLAHDVPDRFAKPAAFRCPLVVERGILPMRHHAPMQMLFPIDATLGAEPDAVVDFAIVADDADRNSALGLCPREMLRLGHALMRLHARELCEASPVGFLTPNLERRVVHRIVAVAHRAR